jgi:hypothetical protein
MAAALWTDEKSITTAAGTVSQLLVFTGYLSHFVKHPGTAALPATHMTNPLEMHWIAAQGAGIIRRLPATFAS